VDETVIVRLELHDFRNFQSIEFRPSPDGLTVIQGENGAVRQAFSKRSCTARRSSRSAGHRAKQSFAKVVPRQSYAATF